LWQFDKQVHAAIANENSKNKQTTKENLAMKFCALLAYG
jgi:hypothetical protein